MPKIQKITPFLWFSRNAQKAAKYYVSVFKGSSRINRITQMKNTPSGTGTELVSVTLFEQQFSFLSGGPFLKINDAISFIVSCRNQKEVDYYWKKLSAVKKAERCGWCRDRFGVTWQVVPLALDMMLADKDIKKSARVTQAMLKMKKLDIGVLRKAYEG